MAAKQKKQRNKQLNTKQINGIVTVVPPTGLTSVDVTTGEFLPIARTLPPTNFGFGGNFGFTLLIEGTPLLTSDSVEPPSPELQMEESRSSPMEELPFVPDPSLSNVRVLGAISWLSVELLLGESIASFNRLLTVQ